MGIRRFFREEKGSALVLIALSMIALLSAAALVTDVGIMYYNKSQVVNAADAAALAGAQALPGDPSTAETMARLYGARNKVDTIDVIFPEDGCTIEVRAQRTTDLFLARVIGHNNSTASAVAVARVAPITSVKGIVPLGIDDSPRVIGETYTLKFAAGDKALEDYHPGWKGILALQGPGAKLYLEDLKYGFDKSVSINEVLNIQTGNISGNTYDGVQYRIDQCKHIPSCTAESHAPDCPRIVLLPVIQPYSDKQIQVIGFAAFFVDSVAGMGNESEITGKFLSHVTAGDSSTTGPNYGLYATKLIR